MIFSVRLRTTDVSNQYNATGAETSVKSGPSTDYSFIEYKFIFSPNMFTLNSSSNITLTDGGQVSNVSINTFTYTGSPLENSNVLLQKENKYYQVNLSRNNNDYTSNMGADHQVPDSPTFGS